MQSPLPCVTSEIVTLGKSQLRGYQHDESKQYDLAILVHKCEGRLFLTDENGYYNDLLAELDKATMGYTLIILTCNKGKLLESTNCLITEDINILATKGS